MSENGNLKYITTCTLCNQRFANSALPVIGEAPDGATVRFVAGLAKHLKQAHPQEIERLKMETAILQNQFVGWLTLQKFETTDPQLLASQQRIRVWLHTLTRRNQLTDADVLDRVARLELAEAEAKQVEMLCTEIRDYMGEQGRYNPMVEAPR
jgi:hypothetical protein